MIYLYKLKLTTPFNGLLYEYRTYFHFSALLCHVRAIQFCTWTRWTP